MIMDLKMANKVPAVVDDLVKALDSKIIKALTEPARAQILKFLMLNGRSDISTIAENLPQDRSVISRHLNMLAEAGIVIAEKETRHRFYTINGAVFLNEFEVIVDNIKKCMAECCPESL
jgi:DNA-binding transcriptional ArsR family regulator